MFWFLSIIMLTVESDYYWKHLKTNTVMNYILFLIYEPYILYLIIYSYVIDKTFNNLDGYSLIDSVYLVIYTWLHLRLSCAREYFLFYSGKGGPKD